MSNASDSLDFSKPWQFSDAVLAVEGDRFHLHRNILGMWSPVFTMMFATGTAKLFPLPGKKSAEIKVLLRSKFNIKFVTKTLSFQLSEVAVPVSVIEVNFGAL